MSLDCLFVASVGLGEFLINKSNNKRQKTSYHCTLPRQNVFTFEKAVPDCTAHSFKNLDGKHHQHIKLKLEVFDISKDQQKRHCLNLQIPTYNMSRFQFSIQKRLLNH